MSDVAELDISEIRHRLREGIPIDFGPRPTEMPDDEWNARREVNAAWILEAAERRTLVVPLLLTNARITGDLACPHFTFSAAVRIYMCDIDRHADFSNCHFEGPVDLSGSIWPDGITLDSAQIDGTFTCNGSRTSIGKSASFMRAAFKDGFEMRGARITHADFAVATFAKDAQFQPFYGNGKWNITRFVDRARFMDAKFAQLANFGSTAFEADADFTRAKIAGPAFFRVHQPSAFSTPPDQLKAQFEPVSFAGKAIFFSATFQAGADFTAAQFDGDADFSYATINRFASFGVSANRVGVSFRAEAKFFGAQVNGRLILEGTHFETDANFEALQVTGNALIRSSKAGNRTVFKGKALFLDASISGSADFVGTRFENNAVFVRTRIGGSAFFTRRWDVPIPTEFCDETNFSDASFAGMATFEGAQFQNVIFRRTQFNGTCYFTGARFCGRADFSDSDFRQDAYWGINPVKGANADGAGNFDQGANFAGARIGGSALFDQAVFAGSRAVFTALKVIGNLQFQNTTFQSGAAFNAAQIGADLRLNLGQPDKNVPVLLNGVTVKGALVADEYLAAYRVDLRTLSVSELDLDVRIAQRLARTSNVHTLLQFEKAYRSSGDERAGDKLYLETRAAERRAHWHKLLARGSRIAERAEALGTLIIDSLRWLFRYGLPTFRVLVYSVVVFFAGVWLLHQPAALDPRNATTASGQVAAPNLHGFSGSDLDDAGG
ncbi:MAG: pentapeptide repeat-containing protein [Acidobacteriaceae bacterium]|nr:pentapeptide repeat-containing protein [Acidobacteriaceae bacterium]MBV9499694.1 pentapeptide repeat-containing protein [Acidobacteriaceae bacterium]